MIYTTFIGELVFVFTLAVLNIITIVKFKVTKEIKLKASFIMPLFLIAFFLLCFIPFYETIPLSNSFIYSKMVITIKWLIIACLLLLGLLYTFNHIHIYKDFIITNLNKKILNKNIKYNINKHKISIYVREKKIGEYYILDKDLKNVTLFMQKYYELYEKPSENENA